MLHDIVLKGSTDRSVTVKIIDSTDGTPETGVVFNTSGIDLWYRREGAARTAITEATLAALTTAHTDGGFLHISDGVYRLDLPDAAFATGANYVDFGGTVTGMVVIGGRVRLVDVNLEDTVRAGLTALPNAAAEAAGGLYTRGTGAGQINQPANGMADVNVVRNAGTAITAASGRQEVNLTHILGTAAATPTVAGVLEVDITHAGGSAITSASGRMEVNVTHAAGTAWNSGAIGASTLATDTLTAAKVAADLGTELATAIWAAASRTLTANTNLNDLNAAGIRAAIGLASANLDTQIGTLSTASALAVVDAIVDRLVAGVIDGAAATGTLSTTQATTNLTGYANDQLIGRIVIWLSGNCEGEASDITDYEATNGRLTFTALTTAPGNGDLFKIV